jgi:large subunit ribosomal protein L29
MKASDIKDLTGPELRQRLDDTRRELFNLRVQKASGQLEKPSRLRDLRRDAARIQTAMSAMSAGAKTK